MMLDVEAAAEARPIHGGALRASPAFDRWGRYGQPRGDLPPASCRLRSNQQTVAALPFLCAQVALLLESEQNRVVVNGMSYSGRRAQCQLCHHR